MPPTSYATTAAPFLCMDQAMKAGIAAAACSVVVLAIVLLAMHMLPVSVG